MAEESVLDKIKKLDEQRKKLLEGARKEALKKAEQAISELNGLGFNYELREKGSLARRTRSGTRAIKDAPCPICNFKTDPPHDGRRHRQQGKNKRPFTENELKQMGLKKTG